MSAILWNGTALNALGIVVDRIPPITKGKKRIETYDVPGRNGFLAVDEGTYEPFVLSLECHMRSSEDFDAVKAALDGYGTLSLDNGVRQYTAIVNNQIDFEKVRQAPFRRFPVQFLVNPIAVETAVNTVTVTSSPTTINIADATTEMFPTITLEGSDLLHITFNNTSFTFIADNTKTYTFQCDLKEVFDDDDLNASALMNGDFPLLKPGTNTISYTGTVTSFTVQYSKAYL